MQDAEAALWALGAPLSWHDMSSAYTFDDGREHRVLFAQGGKHSLYYTLFDGVTGMNPDDGTVLVEYRTVQEGTPCARCYQDFLQAKRDCEQHALTGTWAAGSVYHYKEVPAS